MHIVLLIDFFQNTVSVLTYQFHNLDHAHALAFYQWFPIITFMDIAFTAHALHCVTVTSLPARNVVAVLHVANNKK
jgi:hypothetical protein